LSDRKLLNKYFTYQIPTDLNRKIVLKQGPLLLQIEVYNNLTKQEYF